MNAATQIMNTVTAQSNESEKTEQMNRLYYLSASTIDLCTSVLNRLLTDARSGKLGENVQRTVSSQTSSRSFSCAVKELSVAFCYLIVFDNDGPQMGEQKYRFVSSTFEVIDRVVVGTSVNEIILLNSQALGYEICDSIADSVARLVGAASSRELKMIIAEFLRQSYSIRKNFLFDALNLPSEAISKATQLTTPKTA